MALDRRSRAFIALSVMGIADAVYHAYGELTYTASHLASCSFSIHMSCGSVFASGYTSFLGVSFWVYGVVWFPVCLLFGLWVMRRYGLLNRSILVPFLMIGNIFTLYPWDIEIRILHGVYCPVCVSLYFINYLMTVIALSQSSSGNLIESGA